MNAARALLVAGVLIVGAGRADADPLSSQAIFAPPRPYAIESVRTRYTHFDQSGRGYQSQAGGPPGDEWLTVDQAQLEIVARQGERITHRLWVPLDIVSAASPDALDAISTASRVNEAASVEIASSYQATRAATLGLHGGFHVEEQFRSWDVGAAVAYRFADDNATVAASVNQYLDDFDHFDIHGVRLGRVGRSSTNANLGLTQLLSTTTVAHLDYGVTLQNGVLGNTWNVVPLPLGALEGELLPGFRQRHAFVARLVQWLPWQGALHLYYRFYVDDWGILAHSAEAQLYQRLSPWLWLRAVYRVHQQGGARFFTVQAAPTATLATADSDLAPLVAQTLGGAIALDVPLGRRVRALQAEFGYERYVRTNDLSIDIYTCALGLRF